MNEQENNQNSPPRINKKIKKRREFKNSIDEKQYSTITPQTIPVKNDNPKVETNDYNSGGNGGIFLDDIKTIIKEIAIGSFFVFKFTLLGTTFLIALLLFIASL